MKILKYSILIALLGYTSLLNAQIHYGVKNGFNLANFCFSGTYADNVKISLLPTLPSYQIGGFVEIDINDLISIQPNVIFCGKGAKYSTKYMERDWEWWLNYLEIPAYVKFRSKVTDGIGAFFGIGPYIGFGLSGKVKVTEKSFGTSDTDDVNWGNSKMSDLKTIDFGGSLMIGWEFKYGVQLAINYNYGLNFIPDKKYLSFKDDFQDRIYNTAIGITLGCVINKQ